LHSSRHALHMASSQQHQKLVHSRHWGPNSKKGSSKKSITCAGTGKIYGDDLSGNRCCHFVWGTCHRCSTCCARCMYVCAQAVGFVLLVVHTK
jgi:hypothetical protein